MLVTVLYGGILHRKQEHAPVTTKASEAGDGSFERWSCKIERVYAMDGAEPDSDGLKS